MISPVIINRLSLEQKTQMAESWFELANPSHFWLRHKYYLLKKHYGQEFKNAEKIAEIGCGNGIFTEAMSSFSQKSIDGIDLSENVLKMYKNPSGKIFLYNIEDKNPLLENHYNLIFALDVLEHIKEEKKFLKAISWHLKPKGKLIINVPANTRLYSKYDQQLGHFRRYDICSLSFILKKSDFNVSSHLYWGYSYLPLLFFRKWLVNFVPKSQIVKTGFKTNKLTNFLFSIISRLDFPGSHKKPGASLLLLAQKK